MRSDNSPRVIVSLTSFPAAISYAVGAIRSILEGSALPDRIILYLTYSQFPGGEVPAIIRELEKREPLFEVRNYDEEIRSYRKLIPALQDFPEDVIVTVDDDIRYGKNMLKLLLRYHKKYPKAVIGHRVRHIEKDEQGNIKPYSGWKVFRRFRYIARNTTPAFRNMSTGAGGVLYPPHALKADMLSSRLFMEMAPTTDDIWFWAAAVANGTRIAPVPFGYWDPVELDKPLEISLKQTNIHSGEDMNRKTLEGILNAYPTIKQRIEDEA
ncbi:glycosyltransferase [Bacteroidales bacterium OttesenSCG-928-J19]|nr:glycosyltransferase [Bacteroidales bacterium OttesenSCG-928-J19]